MKHLIALALTALLSPMPAMAVGKFDFSVGYFRLNAETDKGKGSVSNIGAYQMLYRRAVQSQLEVALGYSLVVSKVYTGDMGFGPDLGLIYFPFSLASSYHFESQNTYVSASEIWKPYGGISFHQRQYQSTQSSYAGFSVGAGVEYLWSSSFSMKGELRSLQMTGPQSKAGEIDALVGISLPF